MFNFQKVCFCLKPKLSCKPHCSLWRKGEANHDTMLLPKNGTAMGYFLTKQKKKSLYSPSVPINNAYATSHAGLRHFPTMLFKGIVYFLMLPTALKDLLPAEQYFLYNFLLPWFMPTMEVPNYSYPF